MTLKHMIIFRQVCYDAGFTLAAEKLNMTQPAVSLAIKELESYYGVKLFERMNRRIYLTADGERLLKYAEEIGECFEQAENSLRHMPDMSLRVGCNVSAAMGGVVDMLAAFKTRNSKAQIKVVVDNAAKIHKMLLKNELDLAVSDGATDGEYLKSIYLFGENMLAVCAPSYTKEKMYCCESMCDNVLLTREDGSGLRTAVENVFLMSGTVLSPLMESTSMGALKKAAIGGMGIFITPKNIVAEEIANGKLTIVETKETFARSYYVTVHKSKYLTDTMKLFISELKEKYKKL